MLNVSVKLAWVVEDMESLLPVLDGMVLHVLRVFLAGLQRLARGAAGNLANHILHLWVSSDMWLLLKN